MELKRSVRVLLGKLEDKDGLTAEHSRNVARLSVRLGKAWGLQKKELRELEMGALLHDVDKLNVPEALFDKLRKGVPLDPDDYVILQEHDKHPLQTSLLKRMPKIIRDCQRLHHENFDGTGSPKGLKGEGIPLPVRIVQVADTFDALTLDLPGRPGMAKGEALRTLRQISNTVLDPELVDRFVQIMKVVDSPPPHDDPSVTFSKGKEV